MSAQGTEKNVRVSIPKLQERARAGEKLVMLTCYDASFARISDDAGVDMLLIGDSLGMVVEGHDSTLPVTIEATEYHVRCVARGSDRALVIGDMPFGSFQESPAQAFHNAARLVAAGAQMVKLEGGAEFSDTVRFLTSRSVPVCAHLGLTPQSVHAFGGYRVQGRGAEAERRLIEDAVELEAAGAGMLVLEAIPAKLGEQVTKRLKIPTIGIGAGVQCSGQVLVLHDMLDVFPGKKAKFVRNFMEGASSIADAVTRYVRAVKNGSFPAEEHTF